MNRKFEKAFTLIELLAVIIILAIVALISTPIILNVVDEARESANKSSVAMYADAVKLAVIDNYFENQSYPAVNIDWVNNNVEYGGERIVCQEAYYTESEGVTLHECTIGDTAFNYVDDMKVSAEDTVYCYTKGMVYTDCDDLIYKASYDVASASFVDENEANQPKLFDNMIAVRYDGANWVIADITQEWYNYDAKEWANAVVFNKGVTKNVGEIINVDTEVSQMYVWIPRYKYTIFNGENEDVGITEQEIIINFENGIDSTGTVTCTDNVSGNGTTSETCIDDDNSGVTNGISTYTHPAFTFGNNELTGFWVGKFKNNAPDSTNNIVQTVSIKPNVLKWKNAKVSTFYTSIKNLSSEYELNSDSHMIKNMEWGAVAYLKQSQYGLGLTDIEINSSDYTGGGIYDAYKTNVEQSTTGNIYGVYDMSDETFEYVMGNMVTSTNKPEVGYDLSYNSGFTGSLYDGNMYTGIDMPLSKYYDAYTYDTSSGSHSRGKLGDATKETVIVYGNTKDGWYSDYTYFPSSGASWFVRGGTHGSAAYAGIFNFYLINGNAYNYYASRSVIAAID